MDNTSQCRKQFGAWMLVSGNSFDICSIKKALVAPFNITTVKILCKIYEIKSTSLNLTTSLSLPSSHRRLAKKRLKQSSMVAIISSDFSLGISQMHISAAISSTACKAASITLLAAVQKKKTMNLKSAYEKKKKETFFKAAMIQNKTIHFYGSTTLTYANVQIVMHTKTILITLLTVMSRRLYY
uniref:Uncharacterized protein n=1 Tax=Glossina pallidipes TaxID=7398 RepID=A0A1A9ZID2_GLOPL